MENNTVQKIKLKLKKHLNEKNQEAFASSWGKVMRYPGEWSSHKATSYSQHFSEIKGTNKPVRNQTETNTASGPRAMLSGRRHGLLSEDPGNQGLPPSGCHRGAQPHWSSVPKFLCHLQCAVHRMTITLLHRSHLDCFLSSSKSKTGGLQ